MNETRVLKEEALPTEDVGSRNEVNPSEQTLFALSVFLLDRLKKLKGLAERSDWEKQKADAFQAYHMIPRNRDLPFAGAANLPCPFPRIGVDAFHANVMASVFPDGVSMRIKPVLIQKEFTSKARKAAQYMEYVMNCEAKTYEPMDDADKKAQMFGIGYLEPRYVKEEQWETCIVTDKKQDVIQDPVTGLPSVKEKITKKKEKKKKTIFDGIKIESIPVESIYFSPFFRTLEEAHKMDVVFKSCPQPYEMIKRRSQNTKESPAIYARSQVERVASSIVSKTRKPNSELEQMRQEYDGFYYDLAPIDAMVDTYEAYLWYDIDGDDIKEAIRATFDADSGAILRVSLSKLRIVELVPRPIDERLIGEGIPKICIPLCEEWENFHNTRSNAGQWENSPFGFYRAGGRFNPQTITIKPNHFYPVDDPREISFPQTQRVSSSYFNEEQLLLNYFERIFALSENFQGVQSKRSQTATETVNQSSRASIRFMNPFNRIVTQLNKLINHAWELSCECSPEEKEFFVVGTDGNPIFDKMYKDDYSSRFQFNLEVKSVFDVQQNRDTFLLAYRLFLVNPFVQNHPEVMWDMSQKTLDSLGIDVDLPKPDQAKVLTAYEALELIRDGQELEPEVGIDYDHHLKVFEGMMNTDEIKGWDPVALKNLVLYIDKCKILKATLESSNLNKSGMFNGGPMMPQPGMTASRNPGQIMNNMRVSESGNSAKKNLANGQKGTPPANGGNADAQLNQILGQV